MKWKWLLFDLDNTVLDFSLASREALKATFEHYRIPHDPQHVESYKAINKAVWDDYEEGKLDVDVLSATRARLFLEKIQYTNIDANEWDKHYLTELSSHHHYLEGVPELLSFLKKKGHRLFIVTNGLSFVQRRRWNNTDLSDYFEDIFIAQEVGKPKPYRFYFDVVHGKIGHPNRADVMIIGDNPVSDIVGGNDYGYTTCWYDRGVVSKKPKAHFVVTHMSQVKEIFHES